MDIPKPSPTVSPVPSLTSFKLLSFDIYGTLIDWESSIVQQLAPLLSQLPPDSEYTTSGSGRIKLATKFNEHEHRLQSANPSMRYDLLLAEVYLALAADFNVPSTDESRDDAKVFGEGIAQWQAFPDTVDAMRRLAKYYKLVPLSNVDRASFAKTCSGPLNDVPFWRVYVAEDIGSYKPSLENFHYLLSHTDADDKSEGGEGIKKEEICHVAQSLFHDHVPAKKVGINSVWVNRVGAGMGGQAGSLHEKGQVGYGWRVGTLGELAGMVEEAFTKEGKERA